MKIRRLFFAGLIILISIGNAFAQADPHTYLDDVKSELKKEWPKNRTINLVFHGHSVPSGYFKTPQVNTFESYPFLALKAIKEKYPFAVVNVIITAIGGENSVKGAARFKDDVLTHKPDVLFIDYALNDLPIGVVQSEIAMSKMIDSALAKGIKVILFTPSPHQKYNIMDPANPYLAFRNEYAQLAKKYNIGLVDSFDLFKRKIESGCDIKELMSQVNHPNTAGNQLIADEIVKWF